MGQILLPKGFSPGFTQPGVKPATAVDIDWSNQITNGLQICILGSSGLNLVTSEQSISSLNKIHGTGPTGKVAEFNTAGYEAHPDPRNNTFVGSYSSFQRARINSFGRALYSRGGTGESESENFTIELLTTASKQMWAFWETGLGTNVSYQTTATVSANAGEMRTYGLTRTSKATSVVDFYFDGGLLETSSPLTNSSGGESAGVQLDIPGNHTAPALDFIGDLDISLIWDRPLTSAEHASLNADPYQILKPATPIVYSFPTVAGNINVTPPSGSMVFTGVAPVVSAGGDIAVEVPAGSMVFTGVIPDVSTGANIEVEVPSGSMLYTGVIPTVTIGNNIEISVPSGSMFYTGVAPTVTAGADAAIEIPTGSMLFTGISPTVRTVTTPDLSITLSATIDSAEESRQALITPVETYAAQLNELPINLVAAMTSSETLRATMRG